jgi:hypothetical protein
MAAIGSHFRMAIDALLLRDDAYRSMRDAENPVRRGLALIIAIGLVVALAGIVGAALFQWTTPDFNAIQDEVWDSMISMSWMDEIAAEDRDDVVNSMQQGYDMGWRIADMFIPTVAKAAAAVILKPLGMIVFWLIYGLLAFVTARVLGGRGSLSVTYGVTALAAAPQLLGVFQIVPTVQTAGLGVWTIACSFLALKSAHGLSTGRTFWATVVPYALMFLLLLLLATAGALVFITLLSEGFAEGGWGS